MPPCHPTPIMFHAQSTKNLEMFPLGPRLSRLSKVVTHFAFFQSINQSKIYTYVYSSHIHVCRKRVRGGRGKVRCLLASMYPVNLDILPTTKTRHETYATCTVAWRKWRLFTGFRDWMPESHFCRDSDAVTMNDVNVIWATGIFLHRVAAVAVANLQPVPVSRLRSALHYARRLFDSLCTSLTVPLSVVGGRHY